MQRDDQGRLLPVMSITCQGTTLPCAAGEQVFGIICQMEAFAMPDARDRVHDDNSRIGACRSRSGGESGAEAGRGRRDRLGQQGAVVGMRQP